MILVHHYFFLSYFYPHHSCTHNFPHPNHNPYNTHHSCDSDASSFPYHSHASAQIKLVNISSNDVADGNAKLTLGLVWSIILHWQVKDVMKNVMEDLGQTNLERTLLNWCQLSTKGYEKVDITNFTTSWRDGLAFNALIHHYRPDLFIFQDLVGRDSLENLNHAFDVASSKLGIDKLLDAEDMNVESPDKKSVMTYLMCLFQELPHSIVVSRGAAPSGGVLAEATVSPSSPRADSIEAEIGPLTYRDKGLDISEVRLSRLAVGPSSDTLNSVCLHTLLAEVSRLCASLGKSAVQTPLISMSYFLAVITR
ncbi:hypothetical protein RRG08_002771 [Elysia crispata]|uniref:Calponin-homology (CH) domain-containing protein n=1 Tax=Elysia crispata TaxID=231223 RepID=A0AAE0XUH7_9GAST|nr:hypothetical protein RRG08_002771 [Elysia crispata]